MQVTTTFEQAASRKYPEQVAIAIAKDARGKHNPITLGWTMFVSHEPPMMAIAVGKTRYSLQAIRQAGEFVLSMPSAGMAEEARFHGTKSGHDMDKLAVCGTKTQPATRIDSVLLTDAVANFECKLQAELEAGDHIVFVGRVVESHINEDATLRRLYSLGDEKLDGVIPG
jgi:flavin reductase (DIM6/NTAB) family NADH-FMN oxidoreductase RutF